jgi:glutamate racemase
VVLGCTEYELAAGLIAAALPDATLFGSAAAVAAQALRRAGARGGGEPSGATGRIGTVRVLLSGRPADLPDTALRYPEGRLLARLAAGRRSVSA